MPKNVSLLLGKKCNAVKDRVVVRKIWLQLDALVEKLYFWKQ